MGRKKSTGVRLKSCKPSDGPSFLPYSPWGAVTQQQPWSKGGRGASSGQQSWQQARHSQRRRCGRKTSLIRALPCASYSWRQNSPSGAVAGEQSEDSPRTTPAHIRGIPRNTEPPSPALSCPAAQAEDTELLLLLSLNTFVMLSTHPLRFQEY